MKKYKDFYDMYRKLLVISMVYQCETVFGLLIMFMQPEYWDLDEKLQ